MNDYKSCSICGQDKPLTEFYQRSGTLTPMNWCKVCHQERTHINSRQKESKHKSMAGRVGEQLAISHLLGLGIYAAPGKSSEFNYVDVVAWGCVRIEVKTSRYTSTGYAWAFTPEQQRRGIQADLVLLVCTDTVDDIDVHTFHLFPVNYPKFRWLNGLHRGQLKTVVMYNPNADDSNRRIHKNSLSPEDMTEHKDGWYLIEQFRQQFSDDLRNGRY